jgi:dihydroneopterin aldolase
MNEPTKLLEHLGKRIIDTVFEEFQQVSSVKVKVSKYNPPVGGICQKASVSLKESRQT